MKNNRQYSPGLVVWEITLKCNLKCVHCGSSSGKARSNELSTKEGIQLCREIAAIGFKGITLFGGEPFLRTDWHVFAKEIKELGMKLSIVSSGFVNASKIIPELVKLQVDSVQIGLDGYCAKTHDAIRGVDGSFDQAMEFIRLSKQADLPIGAITTVHKLNFKELPAIRDFIVEKGIDWLIGEAVVIGRFAKELMLSKEEHYALGLFVASTQQRYSLQNILISAPHSYGFFSKYIPNLIKPKEWNGCWAGQFVLGIQSDGGIKGCLALSDDFIEGNVRERPIAEMWNDPDSFAYTRNFQPSEIGEGCRGCEYEQKCKGGCSTRSYSLSGKLHNDPYCYYKIEQNNFSSII